MDTGTSQHTLSGPWDTVPCFCSEGKTVLSVPALPLHVEAKPVPVCACSLGKGAASATISAPRGGTLLGALFRSRIEVESALKIKKVF